MANPSLQGLMDTYTHKSRNRLEIPKLKNNIEPNKLALKGLIIRKGPRHNRVRIKV